MDRTLICSYMMEVARGCGALMLAADAEHIHAKQKSSFKDLVTQYDVQIQNYAIARLQEVFPDAIFISEEGDVPAGNDGALLFVIDPIDGTSNFVHHYHFSCTSIACVQNGETIAAAIYNPFSDEMFHAVRGGGAWLNDRRLQIAGSELAESLVLFGSAPYNPELADATLKDVRSLFGRCLDVRRSGSAALDLCYVACGRAGLYFERILSVWDYAGGALLVTEAGGVCTDMNGKPLTFDRPVKSSVIAGTPAIIAESGLIS